MTNTKIVSQEEWLDARRKLLEQEKTFTRAGDELATLRRELPWVKVDKSYMFEGPEGNESLADLFAGNRQLIVYHFMFGPDWDEGCPSCSFWADNYNGIDIHLQHRDVTLIAVSRAPSEKLQAYRERMGWDFKWVSSLNNEFNFDFHVSFTPEELEQGEVEYNYHKTAFPNSEGPGISVFYQDDNGDVFHTYSAYARGLDIFNGTYHLLDLTPKGRDEDELEFTMAWVRRKDQYED
jgi:predicted dithiol-disulfide oxidoreductase (DUF899 family)